MTRLFRTSVVAFLWGLAPAAIQAQPAPVAAPQTDAAKALVGAWNVTWFDTGQATPMRIDEVRAAGSTMLVRGQLATPAGEVCPLTGAVTQPLTGRYRDGPVDDRLEVPAFVRLVSSCRGSSLVFDLLGLPAGAVLMAGRAQIVAGERREVRSVMLGR